MYPGLRCNWHGSKIRRLFDPRKDFWSEHFQLDQAVIVGLTAIGRVTVQVLGILVQKRRGAERVGMGRRPKAYSTSPDKCFCMNVEQALSPVPLSFEAVVPTPLGMAKIPIVPKSFKHPRPFGELTARLSMALQ